MHKVDFIGLSVEGFGSFQKKATFPLNLQGITLLYGENGNGKTTLFSAFMWCLYKINLKGTNLDKAATWKFRRLPEFRGTRVAVDFSVGEDTYMVIRHLEFKGKTKGIVGNSSLLLFKNGVEVGEELHKGDQQAYIQRFIGVDSKTFLQSVIFGQRMKRLIEADNKDKRDLLETLFDLGFVASAKAKAVTKIVELEAKLAVDKQELLRVESAKLVLVDKVTTARQVEADFELKKYADVNIATTLLLEVELELSTAESNLKQFGKAPEATTTEEDDKLRKDYNDACSAYYKVASLVKSIQSNISDLEKELEKAKGNIVSINEKISNISDICPTCGVKYKDKKHIEASKSLLQDDLKKEQEIIDRFYSSLLGQQKELSKHITNEGEAEKLSKSLKESVDQITAKANQLSGKLREYNELVTSVSVLKERKSNRAATLAEIQARETPVFDFKAFEHHIQKHDETILDSEASINRQVENVGRYKWWNDKAFHAAGLKAFVFEAMLGRLNQYVVNYASRIGLSVTFGIDMTKASKPFVTTCYVEGNEVGYEDLSGGEKQRIDICMAFALHDIISYNTNINTFILDEVFENLDQKGIETVFDFISLKVAQGKCIYVITHQLALDTYNAKSFTVHLDSDKCSYIE